MSFRRSLELERPTVLLCSRSHHQVCRRPLLTENDANTCLQNSPCKTFAQANSVTNPGGQVVALDSTGYTAFSINKAITIEGAPGVNAFIFEGWRIQRPWRKYRRLMHPCQSRFVVGARPILRNCALAARSGA